MHKGASELVHVIARPICQKTTFSMSPDNNTSPQENASEQAVSTCSLALAMLSSFSRVHELASSQDLLEKIPLLIKAYPETPIDNVIMMASQKTFMLYLCD